MASRHHLVLAAEALGAVDALGLYPAEAAVVAAVAKEVGPFVVTPSLLGALADVYDEARAAKAAAADATFEA